MRPSNTRIDLHASGAHMEDRRNARNVFVTNMREVFHLRVRTALYVVLVSIVDAISVIG